MNSTNHKHQKDNYSLVSKTSIIILGLVALSFTNANATTAFKSQDLDQQDSVTVTVENAPVENLEIANETVVLNSTAAEIAYVKAMEVRIAEDKLITESKEESVQPLSLGFTIEDRIAEDNQIIESSVSNEVFPLDFEKINRSVKAIISNNNAIKVTELKL